ncbi:MAG: hypothetical protein LBQ56_02610 [Synergistaceae bacterium]|nr:hypothetical protein [Synergistaceae bacterium]
MHIAVGVVFVVIIAAVSLLVAVNRLKENGAAMEHATRELVIRLGAVEDRLERLERGLLASMSAMRETLSDSARADREELSRNLAALGERQSKSMRELAEAQRGSMETLSDQISKLSAASSDGKLTKTSESRGSVQDAI